ncbi:MAG: DUF3144 domain-containing protein [Sulfurimonas sp.]|uniref:DUF3144 domain-containing protein n=1 Tax=Sulfurimonas sp. TaxID=2022749 RepID=UPI00261B2DB5|nr:DUF3144 domain-containing protein [Sulfurimonas sp.]MCW8894747.1 DUF3144 domain-containing protein [Sulfurimonas sp.]MCW8954332.1 DUF3144 domain-containing protein [Sulfurimonas sp.]MCW9067540.1 DUF3144 domain-containing protein [Sulfurimonas sp.]
MSQNINMEALYTSADKFISLANEIAQKDTSGTVGMGLRYAAARYSAFESSMMTKDMAKEKNKIKEALLKDYEMMLEENLTMYIKHLASQTTQK